MNIFIRMLERLTGRRGEDRGMSVTYDGRSSPDEIEALARMTARAIHPETKFGPPGKKLNIITTGNLDNKNAGRSGNADKK
jgi:hypothetical protein